MAFEDRIQRRAPLGAGGHGPAAARPVGAAGVQPGQVGRLALDRHQAGARQQVQARYRGQQAQGVSTMRPAYITLTRSA